MGANIEGLHDLPIPSFARGFFDPERTREWVKEEAIKGFTTELNKLETPKYKLRVKDVHFQDPNKSFSLREQNDALLKKHDLTLPLKAQVELIDKEGGEVIDSKRSITLAHIPWVTDRNTVIYNGNEYSVTSQQRLKPGIYSRIKDTGDVEAHVNVKVGTGMGGRVIFMPEKALFVYVVGSTQIGLYGLLRDLGTPDQEMEKAWGKEIFLKNKMAYTGTEIDKLYSKIFEYN